MPLLLCQEACKHNNAYRSRRQPGVWVWAETSRTPDVPALTGDVLVWIRFTPFQNL